MLSIWDLFGDCPDYSVEIEGQTWTNNTKYILLHDFPELEQA